MAVSQYGAIYDAAQSPQFAKQVTIALLAAALAIVNEDPATPNHAARLTWAQATRSRNDYLQTLVAASLWRVMSDSRIYGALATFADADVQTVVNALVPEIVATFGQF